MSATLQSSAQINAAHAEVTARGWKLLQPFRFAETDESHIDYLLNIAKFPLNARVLDAGCGIGECARLMKLVRPDLDFVLLNFSEAQLNDCPEGFEKIKANAHDLPFDDGAFDAVMFNAALGNMDCMVALAEASRVLKPGGVLFLNELCRIAGNNDELERVLNFRAYDYAALCEFAEAIGLERNATEFPAVRRKYLKEQMNDGDYERAMQGACAMLCRFIKGAHTPIAAKHGAIFYRHDRVALQISGGKDSLAVLHAMQPWWDRLCVFWTNPGNPFPETVALMEKIKAEVPFFGEVAGRQ